MLHERAAAAAKAAARRDDCVNRLGIAANKEKGAKAALGEAQARRSLRLARRRDSPRMRISLRSLRASRVARLSRSERARQARRSCCAPPTASTEEAIRAELSGFDPETSTHSSPSSTASVRGSMHERKEVFAALDREERRKKELETGIGAELAAQLRRNAEGELLAAAREWAVLKLGARLLRHGDRAPPAGRARPADRARRRRCSRALTGGAFVGLGSHLRRGRPPVLVGQASRGRERRRSTA